VLDTWFSSDCGRILRWVGRRYGRFALFLPTSVLENSYDILFFWVSRMIMMGIENTAKSPQICLSARPDRDEKGDKMSRLKGMSSTL